jgi:hypothetical protein
MADKFPRPYVDSAKQDDVTMVYVNGGEFGKMGIGARKSGIPKGDAAPGSAGSIEHVGDTAGGRK